MVKNAKVTTFTSTYQKLGKHAKIDIETVNPEKAYFIEGSAKLLELDFETIGRTLIPESEIGEADIEARQILSKKIVDDTFYEKMFIWGTDNLFYYTYHGNELFSSVEDEKTFCPVWAFHVIETNDGDTSVNYELRVNASTGTVLQ